MKYSIQTPSLGQKLKIKQAAGKYKQPCHCFLAINENSNKRTKERQSVMYYI